MRPALLVAALVVALGAGLARRFFGEGCCRAGFTPGTLLDAREIPFHEDEPVTRPRTLAWIRAELRAAGPDRAELVLRASAVAPLVEPPPGWEGLGGANGITARELGALLEEDAIGLLTSGGSLAEPRRTRATAGARGQVPVRRLRPAGELDWDARGPDESVLELVLESGPLAEGEYRAEVVARGRARLSVEFEWNGLGGRISALGMGPPSAAARRKGARP